MYAIGASIRGAAPYLRTNQRMEARNWGSGETAQILLGSG